jgi:hypothetical protein
MKQMVNNSEKLNEKAMISRLTREIDDLQQNYQDLLRSKDETVAQNLIANQILEDLKTKSEETQNLLEEEQKSLTTTLEKKEYSLQVCELKIYHYEGYLKRKGYKDQDCIDLLRKFQ